MLAVTLNGMRLLRGGGDQRWRFLGQSLHAVQEKIASLVEGKRPPTDGADTLPAPDVAFV